MFVRCFVLQTIFNCNFQAVQHTCWRTYTLPRVLLSFFLTLFFRPLISEIPERNSTKIGHMVGSKCSLKTHVQNLGYPLPLQIGGQKTPFFGQHRNLTAIFTAFIFGTKQGIDKRSNVLQTTRGLLYRLKTTRT